MRKWYDERLREDQEKANMLRNADVRKDSSEIPMTDVKVRWTIQSF